MKLVILNAGPDTAGCAINLKRAFDRYAKGWETRSICRKVVYFDYPTDIVWPKGASEEQTEQVRELVRQADVVHVMDYEYALVPFRDLLKGKIKVVHHLGTHFRRDPKTVSRNARQYGAIEVTDSIDLLLFPHIRWLPVPADLEALAKLRKKHYRRHKQVRLTHAPTDRTIKSTDRVIAAVEALAKRYPIDFDLIEGVSNTECLIRKSKCDILIDQLTIGFGLNAIEAWAMGIPVVSGLKDQDARDKALALWGQFPWADATEATLEAVTEHLIVKPEWRAELGDRGRAHAEQWHSQRAVVEQTLAIYGK